MHFNSYNFEQMYYTVKVPVHPVYICKKTGSLLATITQKTELILPGLE